MSRSRTTTLSSAIFASRCCLFPMPGKQAMQSNRPLVTFPMTHIMMGQARADARSKRGTRAQIRHAYDPRFVF